MAKKDNFNNNDPISKAVDLLLENTEDLTTVFKEGGLYKELTKRLVEKMLNSEMQNYLGYEKNQHSNSDNARNGISSKKLITQQGKIEIDVSRDRNSNFTPVIVPKRQRRFDGFDQQVLSLYAQKVWHYQILECSYKSYIMVLILVKVLLVTNYWWCDWWCQSMTK